MKKYYLITSIFVASISLVLLSYSVLSLKDRDVSSANNENVVLSINTSQDTTEESAEDVQSTKYIARYWGDDSYHIKNVMILRKVG